jgi:phosphoribosyl 1,2-cyclic phosphate phosphodiesterase
VRVTVLGCGSSTGVPAIGPYWGACDADNPRNRRRRAAIVVERGGTRILVDAPPELREQLLDTGHAAIDAVIFTHAHADHCHGLDDLRGVNYLRDAPLDVFADAATLAEIGARFGYAFAPPDPGKPWYRPALVAHEIAGEGRFAAAGVPVMVFAQVHGRQRTLGLRFGRFAYSTDVNELPEDAFAALAGVDTWLVDCARYEPSHGHASLATALGWIARVAPRRAVLTHMSAELDYDRLRAELPEGVEPAYDGMVIEVAD